MSYVLVRSYKDPFESVNVKHYEIVEFTQILNYTKRTSTLPYEVNYLVHKFDVKGNNVLEECGLSIFEYLDLLKTKSDDIKTEFNYTCTPKYCNAVNVESIMLQIGVTEQDYSNNIVHYELLVANISRSPY